MKHKGSIIGFLLLASLLLFTDRSSALAAFPPVPSGAIVYNDVDSSGDEATFYIWAEGGSLYLHVQLQSLSFTPNYFYVLQDAEQYEWIQFESESGKTIVDFYISMTVRMFDPFDDFDANLPLTLRYVRNHETFSWNIGPITTGNRVMLFCSAMYSNSIITLNTRVFPTLYNGKQADWWLYLRQGDNYYSYVKGVWKKGLEPYPYYQGRLCDTRIADLRIPTNLPAGTYTLVFGVDRIMDGVKNSKTFNSISKKMLID